MIKLEGISKIYNKKKSNEFYALDKVNVEINKGELVAIIGKSGAGKSTMMHIIGCIDDFEEGTYELNGKDISGVSAKKKAEIRNKEIGIVMQDFALIDEYTVEENVMIPLYFTKGVKNKKDKVKSALEKVGIADLKSKPINKLSGGQKQRVAIARAIVNEPEILLADEPTGALDTKTGQEIMNVFKEINDNGKTVIIITHDMEIAKQCKRIIEIKDGKIVS
ncbi:MAG: ABC transporter ATP-binding protein [Clostridiales bacterium]|nr:ABC transporter ATP-binding protein [Clostridiales bacterium]MDD6292599.1 ABC transporter ATP-binding protein [Eubacteriales bacterium]